MKKILLFLFVCIGLKVAAQNAPYSAVVFAEQGEKFWVVINGVKQNTDAQTNVLISGLRNPNYKMKIIFEDNNLPDLDQNLYFQDAGEYTYNIKKNKEGKYVIRVNSFVPTAQIMAPPPGQTVIVYGAAPVTGTVVQQTTTTTTTGNPNDNVNLNMGVNLDGVDLGVNMHVNDGSMNSSTTSHTTVTQTTTTTNGGTVYTEPAPTTIYYVQGYNGPIGCPVPMDAGTFSAAKASIADADFEATKSDVAKSIIGNNCFTTDQVIEMVRLFDFEATRLEIAKFAYPHTYDKGSYFKVGTVFDFDASKSDLNKYISGH